MAAIDRLYLDWYDFIAFRTWVIVYHPKLLMDFYEPFGTWDAPKDQKLAIANFSHAQDRLLLWRCPLPCIRYYLIKRCGLKARWYHKIFWTKL